MAWGGGLGGEESSVQAIVTRLYWYLGLHPQMPPYPPKHMGQAGMASADTVPSLGLAVAAERPPQKVFFCNGGT